MDEGQQQLELLIELGLAPAPVMTDGFTCFVQKTVAHCMFSIPEAPPDRANDAPDVYEDKQFYQRAAQYGQPWYETQVVPHVAKLMEWMRERITPDRNPVIHAFHAEMVTLGEMSAEPLATEGVMSAWNGMPIAKGDGRCLTLLPSRTSNAGVVPLSIHVTRAQAEVLCAIHVVYHLEAYIRTCVHEARHLTIANGNGVKTLIQTWRALATDTYSVRPVAEWHDTRGLAFANEVAALHRTWLASYALFQ